MKSSISNDMMSLTSCICSQNTIVIANRQFYIYMLEVKAIVESATTTARSQWLTSLLHFVSLDGSMNQMLLMIRDYAESQRLFLDNVQALRSPTIITHFFQPAYMSMVESNNP
jgi:hypothetical protein